MLFNSFEFAVFLPLVFFVYWFVCNKNLRLQNLFIVSVSYLFYGWWDWRFLILIAFTSLCSYLSGILLSKTRSDKKRRIITASNIVLNISILCVFKYFNFFSENIVSLFKAFGLQLDWVTLDILLPIGISFYTFQALSYTIDSYKKRIEPTKDIVSFFAYVSFFPQLVAGPIERSTDLLPQFSKKRYFDYEKAVKGLRQILWGLFKKVVVADTCAIAVNQTFENYHEYNSPQLWIGGILFSIQVYGDFSGYSDIAIGTAKLFGIDLMRNFNFPFFSRDVAELWRRWHISLMTWFRDYVYIPLGGSRVSKWQSARNTAIVFLLSGLWHGPKWAFIAWGAYTALLLISFSLLGLNKKYTHHVAENSIFPSLREFSQMASTFILFTIGVIIFRSENLYHAWRYLAKMFVDFHLQYQADFFGKQALLFSGIMIIVEWLGRKKQFAIETLPFKSRWIRVIIYYIIALTITIFGGEQITFIYFQF